MKTTNIEWCDSTLNLQMGCDGCELWNLKTGKKDCYAGVLTERYGGVNKGFPAKFEKPELYLERLDPALAWPDLTGQPREDKPWLNDLPRLIFLDDMGDTFTESLPLDWLAHPYGPRRCSGCPRKTFIEPVLRWGVISHCRCTACGTKGKRLTYRRLCAIDDCGFMGKE